MPTAYLSLGSNVDKEYNLPAAVRLLAEHGRVLAVSAVYETAPVGNPDDPSFIEQQLGRQRSADPNAPRTIDVDISLFDDAILDLGKRHIPDPEIVRFPHIAVPLADLAPDYRHPETGETLAQIAARVTAAAGQPLLRRADIFLPTP